MVSCALPVWYMCSNGNAWKYIGLQRFWHSYISHYLYQNNQINISIPKEVQNFHASFNFFFIHCLQSKASFSVYIYTAIILTTVLSCGAEQNESNLNTFRKLFNAPPTKNRPRSKLLGAYKLTSNNWQWWPNLCARIRNQQLLGLIMCWSMTDIFWYQHQCEL